MQDSFYESKNIARDRGRDRDIGSSLRSDPDPNLPAQQNVAESERAALANFRKSIVDAFRLGRSPNIPNTDRAQRWLAQGYDPRICLAVITELVTKKPSVSNLAYFDSAIRDAHENRGSAMTAVAPVSPRIGTFRGQKIYLDDPVALSRRPDSAAEHWTWDSSRTTFAMVPGPKPTPEESERKLAEIRARNEAHAAEVCDRRDQEPVA